MATDGERLVGDAVNDGAYEGNKPESLAGPRFSDPLDDAVSKYVKKLLPMMENEAVAVAVLPKLRMRLRLFGGPSKWNEAQKDALAEMVMNVLVVVANAHLQQGLTAEKVTPDLLISHMYQAIDLLAQLEKEVSPTR